MRGLSYNVGSGSFCSFPYIYIFIRLYGILHIYNDNGDHKCCGYTDGSNNPLRRPFGRFFCSCVLIVKIYGACYVVLVIFMIVACVPVIKIIVIIISIVIIIIIIAIIIMLLSAAGIFTGRVLTTRLVCLRMLLTGIFILINDIRLDGSTAL